MNEDTNRYLLFTDDYFSIIKKVLESPEIKNIPESKHHFGELLSRLQINISASKPLVQSLNFDSKYKLPLSLILRSISSDVLTILYLITFVDEKSENQITLKNEVLLLDRDYHYQSFEILEEEKSFKEHFIGTLLPKEDLTKYDEEIISRLESNKKLVCRAENGKIQKVNARKIRHTSKDEIIGEDKSDNNVASISEKHKYKRIKNYPLSEISKLRHIFFLYKYYSQFYHSCPANFELINHSIDIDCYYLQFIQYYVVYSSAWVTKILLGEESPLFSQMTNLLDGLSENH